MFFFFADTFFGKLVAVSIPECGPGDWYTSKVISLNVSDPDQTCPTNWQERTNPASAKM